MKLRIVAVLLALGLGVSAFGLPAGIEYYAFPLAFDAANNIIPAPKCRYFGILGKF